MVTITSKQKSLAFVSITLFIAIAVSVIGPSFTQNVYVDAQGDQAGKIVPPQPIGEPIPQITSIQAAEKIVRHGYALMDAHIKEITTPRCDFSDGEFLFWFNSGIGKNVLITPDCVWGFVWRTTRFTDVNGDSAINILDGPFSRKRRPGTPNEEVINGVINYLSTRLSDSDMIVKIIYKDGSPDLFFDLSDMVDFQRFIALLFNSINLSEPLSSEQIDMVVLSEGTHIRIAPTEDNDPVKIGGVSSSFSQMATNVYFEDDKQEMRISVDKAKQKSLLEIGGEMINTQKAIEIKDSKLYMETAAGTKEIMISPNDIYAKGREMTTSIEEVKLTEESQNPVYSIRGTKQAKLFFFLPVTLNLEMGVSAESGEVLSTHKPWWSFLTW